MRKARQQGYLDAFMKQINMSELLFKENTIVFNDAVQTTAVKRPPLKVIKNNDEVPNKMNTSDKQRKNLHIIK